MTHTEIKSDVSAEAKSGVTSMWEMVQQKWERSPLSRRISTRFLKFLVVGGSGVFVNLVAMALLLRLVGWRDWRLSAMASVVAAFSNYLLNNHWTFSDRRRTGRALSGGVFLYLIMSGVGIAVTAAIYAGLTRIRFATGPMTSYIQLMGIQLIAIAAGTYLNYVLNNSFTWRETAPVDRDRSVSGSISEGTLPGSITADIRKRTLKSCAPSGPTALVLPE
jgi:dolichol-phosphate mannosyltransferase